MVKQITLKGFNEFQKELLEFQRQVTANWQDIINSPMDPRRGEKKWAYLEEE